MDYETAAASRDAGNKQEEYATRGFEKQAESDGQNS
jgi:hypothetical protein